MSQRTTLPVHLALYLHPDRYEDSWASNSGGGTPQRNVNYMLRVFGPMVERELDSVFPQWRSAIGQDSRPILTMYTYRMMGPCAEALRCGSDDDHDQHEVYYPTLVAYFLGLFRWISEDKMFPQTTAEQLFDYLENTYLDRDDQMVHPGTRLPRRRTYTDVTRIALAFHPLLKRYVEWMYDSRVMDLDRMALYREAETVARTFSTTYQNYLNCI